MFGWKEKNKNKEPKHPTVASEAQNMEERSMNDTEMTNNSISQQTPENSSCNSENVTAPVDQEINTEQASHARAEDIRTEEFPRSVSETPCTQQVSNAVSEKNGNEKPTECPVPETTQQENLYKEDLQTIVNLMNSVKADVAVLATRTGEQKEILESCSAKDEIIQNMHRELTEYRNNFKQEIMLPMVKSMIRLYDRLAKLTAVYETKFAAEENLPQSCRDFLSEISTCAEVILSSLAEFDIEQIRPETGSLFEHKKQRCVRTEPASEQNPANTIAEVLKIGFENTSTGRIIDYPEVVVFK